MGTVLINSMRYKLGRFGRVFVDINGEWVLSSVTKETVEAALRNRERKKYLRSIRQGRKHG